MVRRRGEIGVYGRGERRERRDEREEGGVHGHEGRGWEIGVTTQ